MRAVFHKYEALIRSLNLQRATEKARRKEVERAAQALSQTLQNLESQGSNAPVSYAETTKGNNDSQKTKTFKIASATIKPKQGKSLKNLSSTLKKELTEAKVLLTDATIRPTKAGLLIVESRKEDINKIERIFNESDNLTECGNFKVNTPPRPEVKFKFIEEGMEKKDIKNELIYGNDLQEHLDQIDVKYVRSERDGTQTAFISLPKEAYNTLTKEGTIKIGWSRCIVEEHYNVKRCTKCLTYGHVAKFCKGTQIFCPFCSNNHKEEDCKAEEPRCRACLQSNMNSRTPVDLEHKYYDRNCPTYIAQVQRIQEQW
ncbi:uncharacterized protein LOC135371638 [Ornithodoros turicata]|uniref:uncharacterized protein LOC135371638 n=1 Tax=Ornithodoros turicata TaxID=34597 RepID=UPI00313A3300